MTVSVLAPIRDEGTSLRERIRANLHAVAGLEVELIVLDNQSIDGCCHGLPPDVLIIRTERVESPSRLWRLGRSLATGDRILWLPEFSSVEPDRFGELILKASDVASPAEPTDSRRVPRLLRFSKIQGRTALLTREARSRLDRWARAPLTGPLLSSAAARWLRLFVPLEIGQEEDGRKLVPCSRTCAAGPAAIGHEASSHSGIRAEFGPAPGRSPDDDCDVATTIRRDGRTSNGAPRDRKQLSVIITTHNEGTELRRTVESVRASSDVEHEIIVVDDGSTDRSTAGLEALGVRVIRHAERVGVAHSRDVGSRAARGDVFAYLDAHQRVDRCCLDRCAELAFAHDAIVCPPCRPLNRRHPIAYGASFALCPEEGFFSARYRTSRPRQVVSRITALRSPGYVIPRSAYRKVGWITGLRGWGATDYSVALKAFFTDVDILQLGISSTEHLFRQSAPYKTNWSDVWRNHALIARVCFDDRTWQRYWLPEVFRANIDPGTLDEMDSPAILAEHEAFMALKVRPDREFWRGLLRIPEPMALT